MKEEELEELERALRAANTCRCDDDLLCDTHKMRFRETWDCRYLPDLLERYVPAMLAEIRAARAWRKEAQAEIQKLTQEVSRAERLAADRALDTLEAERLLGEVVPWLDVLAKQWDHGGTTWRELTNMRNRAATLLDERDGTK